MKIHFEWQNEAKVEQAKSAYATRAGYAAGSSGSGSVFNSEQTILTLSENDTKHWGWGDFGEKIVQEAGADAYTLLKRNYHAVMSNSLSGKDFMKLDEEGFDVYSMEPEETITILDKIKAELVRSGVNIEGYTDDISRDKLEELTGSRALANKLTKALKEENVPVTEENIRQLENVLRMAEGMGQPKESSTAYMVSRSMEPTLENLYQAGYQCIEPGTDMRKSAYTTGSYGRQGENYQHVQRTQVTDKDLQQLEGQMKKRVEECGYEADHKNLETAGWLMDKGLAIDGQNIELKNRIDSLVFPLDKDVLIRQAARALAEGRSPAAISIDEESESIYAKAVGIYERYNALTPEAADWAAASKLPLSLINMENCVQGESSFIVQVQARKNLEEVRLKMTVEANLKLLRSGFAIDTAPMEELILKLDEAARDWELSVLGEHVAGDKAGRAEGCLLAVKQIGQLPYMPLALVGRIPEMERPTLGRIAQEGKVLQSRYQAAGESYEALMTAPRKDLGDSIAKAFRNTDEILQEMGMEANEENQRAIRILGYNQMEITRENLQIVQRADRQVREVIAGMQPAVTLEMIRKGRNPMEMTLEELQEYIRERDSGFEEDTDKYSKFLYKLEQRGDIAEDERKAYIGIYRLFRQIEKSDGAVIGSLVAQGADLNFSNLLSAVRTRKAKPTDIRIDDSTGILQKLETRGISISAQIEEGFKGIQSRLSQEQSLEQLIGEVEDIVSDEQLEERYVRQRLQDIRNILKNDGDQADQLRVFHQPVTLDNLQSLGVLTQDRGKTFQRIKTWEEKFLAKQESLLQEKKVFAFLERSDHFLERIEEAESRQEDYQSMIKAAATVLEDAVSRLGEEASHVDIRGIQQLYKQLHLSSRLAEEENYEIPVWIGDEVTSINLKMIRRPDAQGEVKITLESGSLGKVEARFCAKADFLEGSVLTQYMDKRNILEEEKPLLTKALTEVLEGSGLGLKEIWFGDNPKLDLNKPEESLRGEKVDTTLLYKAAKEFIAFIQKIG